MPEPRKFSSATELVARVDKVPSLPRAAARILEVLQAKTSNASQVAQALERDPPIAARLLRLANSGAYARGSKISAVAAAVARVGLEETRGLVLSATIAESLTVKPNAHIASFQLHSVVCAAITGAIAAKSSVLRASPRDNPYFTPALLHDIGLIALAHFSPIALVEVVDFSVANKAALADIERIAMGYSHAEVGALLLQRWRLSQVEVDACRWHHDFFEAPASAGAVPALMHLADALAREALGGDTLAALVPELDPRAIEQLKIPADALPALRQEVVRLTASARTAAAAYFSPT